MSEAKNIDNRSTVPSKAARNSLPSNANLPAKQTINLTGHKAAKSSRLTSYNVLHSLLPRGVSPEADLSHSSVLDASHEFRPKTPKQIRMRNLTNRAVAQPSTNRSKMSVTLGESTLIQKMSAKRRKPNEKENSIVQMRFSDYQEALFQSTGNNTDQARSLSPFHPVNTTLGGSILRPTPPPTVPTIIVQLGNDQENV